MQEDPRVVKIRELRTTLRAFADLVTRSTKTAASPARGPALQVPAPPGEPLPPLAPHQESRDGDRGGLPLSTLLPPNLTPTPHFPKR